MRRAFLIAIACLAVATTAVAATPPPTRTEGQLTVGVNLPSEGFQVGVVRGSDVLLAQGLEIDLARTLATRLGLAQTVFVQSRFDRLFSAGLKPWDAAIAQISITPARKRVTDFSVPYMKVDQAVLLSQSYTGTPPRTIAALRALKICVLAKSTGVDAVRDRVNPTKPPLLVGNVPSLLLNVQTGKCAAAVYDAPVLATLKARAPLRYGVLAGVIRTGETYGIAVPQGSPLLPTLNTELTAMLRDGTIARLQRKWLAGDPAKLAVLR